MPAPAASLRAEGRAMLGAILEDLAQLDGVELLTLVDENCETSGAGKPPLAWDPALFRRARSGEEEACFRELARWADATLVIAPEFDDILLTRCRWVLEAGGRLLGPGPEAVRLTGDKGQLGRHLGDWDVPVPATCRSQEPASLVGYPLVVKPRQGAGSLATFLVQKALELETVLAQARKESGTNDLLLQSFVPGGPASVAWLIGPRQRLSLAPAAQRLSTAGRIRYQGGTVPLPADQAGRAVRLAGRALATIPGLCGYVGVDLVLGAEADGSQDRVIEVNPRLTTSYVGLRRLTATNLAGAMLRLAAGESIPPLAWDPGAVRFWPDGTVQRTGKK
jgi:predicted ATP-grasp superfamily ATP-dependent carboligase